MKSLLPPIMPHPGGLQIHAAISFSAFIYPGRSHFLTRVESFATLSKELQVDSTPLHTFMFHSVYLQSIEYTLEGWFAQQQAYAKLPPHSIHTWNWRRQPKWWTLTIGISFILFYKYKGAKSSVNAAEYLCISYLSTNASYTTWAGQFSFCVFKSGRPSRKQWWYSKYFV